MQSKCCSSRWRSPAETGFGLTSRLQRPGHGRRSSSSFLAIPRCRARLTGVPNSWTESASRDSTVPTWAATTHCGVSVDFCVQPPANRGADLRCRLSRGPRFAGRLNTIGKVRCRSSTVQSGAQRLSMLRRVPRRHARRARSHRTPSIPLKSASCVQSSAPYLRAVARMIPSAGGNFRSTPSAAALTASSAPSPTTVPCCMAAVA